MKLIWVNQSSLKTEKQNTKLTDALLLFKRNQNLTRTKKKKNHRSKWLRRKGMKMKAEVAGVRLRVQGTKQLFTCLFAGDDDNAPALTSNGCTCLWAKKQKTAHLKLVMCMRWQIYKYQNTVKQQEIHNKSDFLFLFYLFIYWFLETGLLYVRAIANLKLVL